MGDFEALRLELRSCAQGDRPGLAKAPPLGVRAFARELVLAHRVGRPRDFVEALLSGEIPKLRAESGKPRRQALGTDGCVFLWVGASAYEQPPFVIFPVLEIDEEVVAAPWDTGGLARKGVLGRQMTEKEATDFVTRYSLPAPTYRDYLAEVLHCCFEAPSAYLQQMTSPSRCYPGREGRSPKDVGGEAGAPQTFEARVKGHLSLASRVLSIVFDPAALWDVQVLEESRRLTRFREWCRKGDVRLRAPALGRGQTLRDLIVEEAEQLLRQRGAIS